MEDDVALSDNVEERLTPEEAEGEEDGAAVTADADEGPGMWAGILSRPACSLTLDGQRQVRAVPRRILTPRRRLLLLLLRYLIAISVRTSLACDWLTG